jgi:hypothetical protein
MTYYTPSYVTSLAKARSAEVNGQLDAIAAGFNQIPDAEKLQQNRVAFYTAGGTANALTVTASPPISSYTKGLGLIVEITATNTGAATIDVNGLGARSIKRQDGTNVEATDLTVGDIHQLRYDGTNFVLATQSRVHLSQSAATSGASTVEGGGKFTSFGATSGFMRMGAKLATGSGIIEASTGGDTATQMDFDFPDVSTADADFRMFYGTNTTGNVEFTIYQGNGTGTKVHSFFAASALLCRGSGFLGVGVSSALAKLHVRDDTAEVARFHGDNASMYLSLMDNATSGGGFVGVGAIGDDLTLRAGNAVVGRFTGTSLTLLTNHYVSEDQMALGMTTPDGSTRLTLKNPNGYAALAYEAYAMASGNVNVPHIMRARFASANDEWYMFPEVDGSDDFANRFFFDYNNEVWGLQQALFFRDMSPDPAAIADHAGIFAKSGELYHIDGAGNKTLQSPHSFDGFEPSEPMAWSFRSTSAKHGQEIFVDMLKVIRAVEQLSGDQLVHIKEAA